MEEGKFEAFASDSASEMSATGAFEVEATQSTGEDSLGAFNRSSQTLVIADVQNPRSVCVVARYSLYSGRSRYNVHVELPPRKLFG